MRGTMRWLSRAFAVIVVGGFLLSAAPQGSAQVRGRVFVGHRFGGFGGGFYPWGYYPYGYGYAPYYAFNYGEVKIDTHRKDLAVYIDGGYAAETKHDKKFTLRPGNHDIELRNSEGQTVYQQNVAVIVGKTTKLPVS